MPEMAEVNEHLEALQQNELVLTIDIDFSEPPPYTNSIRDSSRPPSYPNSEYSSDPPSYTTSPPSSESLGYLTSHSDSSHDPLLDVTQPTPCHVRSPASPQQQDPTPGVDSNTQLPDQHDNIRDLEADQDAEKWYHIIGEAICADILEPLSFSHLAFSGLCTFGILFGLYKAGLIWKTDPGQEWGK